MPMTEAQARAKLRSAGSVFASIQGDDAYFRGMIEDHFLPRNETTQEIEEVLGGREAVMALIFEARDQARAEEVTP